MNILKVSNVSKNFGKNKILDSIDFVASSLEIIGLAGTSGSGKSTLLRCIQKLETIDAGTIQCSEKIGFVFQDFQLFPHMTVLDNLLYAPSLINTRKTSSTLHKFTTEAKETNESYAKRLLNDLGIIDKIYYYPSELSGGQKQRVALARSLMMRPGLLLCDEPTSGLDIATSSDVADLLDSVRKLGITIIIASHDLDFLVKIADRIIVLKSGNISIDIEPKSMANPVAYLKNYY